MSNQPLTLASATKAHDINEILGQLGTVLIGKDKQIRLAMACLIANGHLLIEDVPGVGKTTLAQALGALLGLDWSRVQFTSDLLPADVLGVSIYNSQTQSFDFKPGPVFTSILLADEINRAPPRAQSALLEAMEERQISIDGKTWTLPEHFLVIATQNAADQLGAYPLPESQLDRFLAGIELGYPDAESERQLLKHGDRRATITNLSSMTNANAIEEWKLGAQSVEVSDSLINYIQALLLATREGEYGTGLSPRAGLGLLNLAKAWTYLDQREFVLPEDIQAVFPSVAGHRITGSVKQGAIASQEILERVALR